MYLPSLGSIRGQLLPEDRRTTFMNMIKIPSYFSGAVSFLYMTQVEETGLQSIWGILSLLILISLVASLVLTSRVKPLKA